jgi:hypothetical protein
MTNRTTNLEKLKRHEEHRHLHGNNLSGDTHAPASPAKSIGANTDKLAQLAEELRLCHESFQRQESLFHAALKMSVAEGIKCGMILMEVKSIVGHGHFMDWVMANTPISQKTVQRFIKLAENRESVTILNATSLTDCYVALGLVKKPVDDDGTATDQKRVAASPDDDGEDSEENIDSKEALFAKAKDLSDRLAQLAVQTSDQERMAVALKSIIGWYQDYLALKEATQKKAEQDADFEKEISITA